MHVLHPSPKRLQEKKAGLRQNTLKACGLTTSTTINCSNPSTPSPFQSLPNAKFEQIHHLKCRNVRHETAQDIRKKCIMEAFPIRYMLSFMGELYVTGTARHKLPNIYDTQQVGSNSN
jgi:hypothetical protein